MFNIVEKTVKVGTQNVTLEVGRIARQASGSVFVTSGDTQLLVTACVSKSPKPGIDFFPLAVDYFEKIYGAGRIPGGYLKREGKASDREVLISRLIDRPIRPLFPEAFKNEVQVAVQVMSVDPLVSPAPLAILGASLALQMSEIPFNGPVAGVRVGLKDGKYTINPPESEADDSDLDIVVAGTAEAILMVEAGAKFVSEKTILEAIAHAHEEIKKLCAVQVDLCKAVGKTKWESPEPDVNQEMKTKLAKAIAKPLAKAMSIPGKHARSEAVAEVEKQARELVMPPADSPQHAVAAKQFAWLFEDFKYKTLRSAILSENRRVDGRTTTDIRQIVCQPGLLKRPHGSALFTRGETQSIGVCTLGTSDDCLRQENVYKVADEKFFMLHYNFPGYSVGEPKRFGPPARREVGHGALAERALRATLPNRLKFPYTIRLVSEITESNGSSSMASVCSGTLALMDAGVPIVEPVAGIAMGLILEGESYAILSDINGDEDGLGDMDFKVAGGKNGICALQMDIKIGGVTLAILKDALEQAREGRMHILSRMLGTLPKTRDLSPRAPRIEQIRIKPDRVRDLIGPGGKNIKKVVAETNCKIEVNDEGVVLLASSDGVAAQKARRMIQYLTTDPEINDVYLGLVKKVTDFGAFVEIKPGVEGLVHISHLAATRINRVDEVVKEGDEVLVKVIEVDRTGRIKLSRKDAVGQEPRDSIKAWIG